MIINRKEFPIEAFFFFSKRKVVKRGNRFDFSSGPNADNSTFIECACPRPPISFRCKQNKRWRCILKHNGSLTSTGIF